jgi:hypothetical protein
MLSLSTAWATNQFYYDYIAALDDLKLLNITKNNVGFILFFSPLLLLRMLCLYRKPKRTWANGTGLIPA